MPYESPFCFFLGANTPLGFFGIHTTDLYDARDGWVAYLIKSGAGTGKATFMRDVQASLAELGVEGDAVYCSSDPQSLDAIVYRDIKLCVIDATSPHIIEPIAYGECEQLVPFGCCLDTTRSSAQADAWFEAADACAAGHARCCRFMAAANGLLLNNRRLAETAVLSEKLNAAVHRLATRECGTTAALPGRRTRRLLSAITPQGPVFFKDTATALCPKLYVVDDDNGAVAAAFMEQMEAHALKAGHDVISCLCPLRPQDAPEHLLIPSLGVGFLTSNRYHTIDFPVFRRIHASRFLNNDLLKGRRQQLGFNRRAAKELLGEAVAALVDAKAHHDRMEALHIDVMDWTRWQEIAQRTKADILALAQRRSG